MLHPPPPFWQLGLSGDGQVSVSVQIAYNAWIAAQTHARGMGVAMKNNNEAAAFHVHDYDMVVNEECWINGNCNNYVSMSKSPREFCTRCSQATLSISWAFRVQVPAYALGGVPALLIKLNV